MVTEISNCLKRKFFVNAFCFLQTKHVRAGFRKPFENGFKTNSDGVYIPGCDFHTLTGRPRFVARPSGRAQTKALLHSRAAKRETLVRFSLSLSVSLHFTPKTQRILKSREKLPFKIIR